jgi:hypothetical protein
MSSPATSAPSIVSRDLLDGVATTLEETKRRRGGFNHMVARYAGNASRLFAFSDLEARFQALLTTVTPELYWAGAFTNLDTTKIPDGGAQLSPLAKIEQEYPVFAEDYATAIFRRMGDHLSHCVHRDYDGAFAQAETELAKEEVILGQVLMGDFDLANESLPRLSEEHRRQSVIFVSVIELYRAGREAEAEVCRRKLPVAYLTDWGGAQLALGASNRVPWEIYPFPDY